MNLLKFIVSLSEINSNFRQPLAAQKNLSLFFNVNQNFYKGKHRHVHLTPPILLDMEVDPIADKLLQHCHFQLDKKAIKYTGVGDCL